MWRSVLTPAGRSGDRTSLLSASTWRGAGTLRPLPSLESVAMKVLVALESTARWAYHESTIEALCRNGDSVRVLFGKEARVSPFNRVVERLSEQGGVDVELGWLTRRSDRWGRIALPARALRSYSSYLRDTEQSDYYRRRWADRLEGPLQRTARLSFVRRLLAMHPVFRGLGALERRIPPANEIVRELVHERPDVVVASPANKKNSAEIEYVKAARRLGIPSVVPVLSWDNLTTKGLIHAVPDVTLVWNETQRSEAMRIHGIPSERVAVTGAPFFDPWFQDSVSIESREAFCARVGLDPEEPFAVYLGSSHNIARDETWLVRALARELREAADPRLRSLQLLVRPHPANALVHGELEEPNVVVWPKAGRLPDSESSRQEFRATLGHAVGAIGINTSGMIDAVIADRPCVALMVPEYDETQRNAVHFKYLVQANTLELADGPSSCVDVLLTLMRGIDSTRDARRRFVESFVRPRGRGVPAGALAARAIALAAQGVPGNMIDERLVEAARDPASGSRSSAAVADATRVAPGPSQTP